MKFYPPKKTKAKSRKAFGYIDAITSIALLMMCVALVLSGINFYFKSSHHIRTNQKIDNIIKDEIVLLHHTKTYSDKELDGIKIKYKLVTISTYKDRTIEMVKIIAQDEKTKIQREHIIAFKK